MGLNSKHTGRLLSRGNSQEPERPAAFALSSSPFGAAQLHGLLLSYHWGLPLVMLLEDLSVISPATDTSIWPSFLWVDLCLPRRDVFPTYEPQISVSIGRDCISKEWKVEWGTRKKMPMPLIIGKLWTSLVQVSFCSSLCTNPQQVGIAAANLRSPAYMALLHALHECYMDQIFSPCHID